MKSQFAKQCRSLDHRKLSAYLKNTGWEHYSDKTSSQYWDYTTPDDKVFQLVVPLNEEWRDYGRRILNCLRVLDKVENRSKVLILHDIEATEIPETEAEEQFQKSYGVSPRSVISANTALHKLDKQFEALERDLATAQPHISGLVMMLSAGVRRLRDEINLVVATANQIGRAYEK